MKWRTLGIVLIGILLPLPLLWLLVAASFGPGVKPASAPHRDIIPMLMPVDRQNVLTYGRKCHTDMDCDPRLRCFFSMVTQDSYCVDSRCMTDSQCPEGFTCQTYTSDSGKDLLNACSLVGDRKEGEVCAGFTRERQYGCEQGLLCHYRCGRSCQLDDPASCPEGFFCEDTPTGAVCQPTCAGSTCPEGQQCVSVAPRISICATVHGQNCQQTPCEQEQSCTVSDYPLSPGEVWMGCQQPCGTHIEDPPCPKGSVCDLYRCRQVCTPEDSAVCGPGFICKRRPDDVWLCESDHRTESAD
jgi:hypothetical protein